MILVVGANNLYVHPPMIHCAFVTAQNFYVTIILEY
jgi:hypothetical protein